MNPPAVIRAKVKVSEVTTPYAGAEQVKGHAVYDGSEENASYSKFTPAFDFNITITNPTAHGFFQAGKSYYVDFTPA